MYYILILCTMLALVPVVTIFFLNRSEQAVEILKPFGIAFAVAYGYVVFAILVPKPMSETEAFQVSIFSKANGDFLRMDTLPAERWSSQHIFFRLWTDAFGKTDLVDWRAPNPPKVIERKRLSEDELTKLKQSGAELYLDLLQLGYFEWLRDEFRAHWAIEIERYSGFGGGGMRSTTNEEAEKEVEQISRPRILELLSNNRFIKAGAILSPFVFETKQQVFDGFTLPRGSNLRVEAPNALVRKIFIRKPFHFDLSITLKYTGTVNGLRDHLGKQLAAQLKLDAKTANEVLMYVFTVAFEFQRHRFLRWNPSVVRYSNWAKEMAERFRWEFGWDEMRSNLEKALSGTWVFAHRFRRLRSISVIISRFVNDPKNDSPTCIAPPSRHPPPWLFEWPEN
jgi:hypothetical protein